MIELEFIDTSEAAYLTHPIRKASQVDGNYKDHQKQKYGIEEFAACPGMLDLKNVGYIIPAWTEIKIYADKHKTYCYIGNQGGPAKNDMTTGGCPYTAAGLMRNQIVDGIPGSQIKHVPLHLNSPWVVKGNTTLLALPAFYHSNMTDKYAIWPGLVDIKENQFNTFNIILGAKQEGEFTIKPGEPLVHVIPYTKEDCSAKYGPSVDGVPSMHYKKSRYGGLRQWYRRLIMRKTKYTLEPNYK